VSAEVMRYKTHYEL